MNTFSNRKIDMFLDYYEWSDSTGEERALDQVQPLVIKHTEGELETRPEMSLHPAPGQWVLDLLMSVCHVPGFTLRDFYELTFHCCNDPHAGRVLFRPAGELTGSGGGFETCLASQRAGSGFEPRTSGCGLHEPHALDAWMLHEKQTVSAFHKTYLRRRPLPWAGQTLMPKPDIRKENQNNLHQHPRCIMFKQNTALLKNQIH